MSAAFSVMSSKSWSRSANMIAVIDCDRSEEHTSELQSRLHLVCRLLLEKKKCEHLRPCHALHKPTKVLLKTSPLTIIRLPPPASLRAHRRNRPHSITSVWMQPPSTACRT